MPLGRAAARPEGADVRACAHVRFRLGGREELGLEWRERERRELALLDHDADGGALVDAAVRGDDRVVKEQQRDRAAELGRLDEQVVEGALRLVAHHAPRHIAVCLAQACAEALAQLLDERRRVGGRH